MKARIVTVIALFIAICEGLLILTLYIGNNKLNDQQGDIINMAKSMIRNRHFREADTILRMVIECSKEQGNPKLEEARRILWSDEFLEYYKMNDITTNGSFWSYSKADNIFDKESARRMFGNPHQITNWMENDVKWEYLFPSNTVTISFSGEGIMFINLKSDSGSVGITSLTGSPL